MIIFLATPLSQTISSSKVLTFLTAFIQKFSASKKPNAPKIEGN